jgi:hypothetical protein
MKNLYLLFSIIFFFSLSGLSQMKIEKDTPVTTGETIYLKYHQISITPPQGYYFLEKYSSFVNMKDNTTISVAKKKGMSYKKMIANFSDANSKLGNAKMISSTTIGEGTFLIFEFEIQGQATQRMMYLIGDENVVYYAMANYKVKDKAKSFDVLKKTILSIKL